MIAKFVIPSLLDYVSPFGDYELPSKGMSQRTLSPLRLAKEGFVDARVVRPCRTACEAVSGLVRGAQARGGERHLSAASNGNGESSPQLRKKAAAAEIGRLGVWMNHVKISVVIGHRWGGSARWQVLRA